MKAKIYQLWLLLLLFVGGAFFSSNYAQSVPVLGWPIGGATVYSLPVQLSWYHTSYAGSGLTYNVVVTTSTTTVYDNVGAETSGTTLSIAGLLAGTTYQWKVRSKSGSSYSAFSPIDSFTVYGSAVSTDPIITVSSTDISPSGVGATATVDVSLNLNGATAQRAYSGTISYDNTRLTYAGAITGAGTLINDNSMYSTFTGTAGGSVVKFVAVGVNPIVTTSGNPFFKLQFTIAADPSPSTLIPSGFKGQSPGTITSFTYNNGTITWTDAASLSTVRGDANLDGVVDLLDIVAIAQHIAASPLLTGQGFTNADVAPLGGNGTVDISDLNALLDFVNTGAWPAGTGSPLVGGGGKLLFADTKPDEFGQLYIPLSVVGAKNVKTGEIIFSYDSAKISYQSFAVQLQGSKNFVDAKEIAPGKAKFIFATAEAVDGNLNPGKVILKFKDGSIPVGSAVTTDYSINGGEFQAGPSVSFTVTGIETDNNEIIPEEFEVSQNYPNPFNPTTSIKYGLPEAAKVTIKIYNMLGQEIKTLINAEQAAGYHSVIWKGDNNFGQKVTSGAYIYRIVSGNNVVSKKMLLIK